MKTSRKWHYVTESEGDTDVIEVQQSPPSKVKKSAAKKKKPTSSCASSANVSSKKRQVSETESESESKVESLYLDWSILPVRHWIHIMMKKMLYLRVQNVKEGPKK